MSEATETEAIVDNRPINLLESVFKLRERGTTVKTEVIAGATTFLTMAYIIFVNPNILSAAGMDHGAIFVATCLSSALGCLVMGLYANYPIALAPGMGLNAYFTYTVVQQMHYSWEVALGAVFVSAVMFLLLSMFKVREWVINSIPLSLRKALSAGIGLFLAIIALKSSGLIQGSAATLVTLGDLHTPGPLLAALSFILIAGLSHLRVPGAVLIGVLVVSGIGAAMGLTHYAGIVSIPPSLAPTLGKMDIAGTFNVGMIGIIFSFLFVEMFDTAGTLMGVAHRANLIDEKGNMPGISKALMADSTASIAGSFLGSSTLATFVESAAGIAAGGRTGLTAVVCAIFFLASMFLAPLAGMVPAYATAGALLYVAVLMTSGLAGIDWDDISEAAPAVVAAVMMPLTFSITNGIGLAFITYTAIKLVSGRLYEIKPSVYVLCILFVLKFAFL